MKTNTTRRRHVPFSAPKGRWREWRGKSHRDLLMWLDVAAHDDGWAFPFQVFCQKWRPTTGRPAAPDRLDVAVCSRHHGKALDHGGVASAAPARCTGKAERTASIRPRDDDERSQSHRPPRVLDSACNAVQSQISTKQYPHAHKNRGKHGIPCRVGGRDKLTYSCGG